MRWEVLALDLDDLLMDHEAFAGAVIPDPWEDPDQKDWPMAKGVGSVELGSDEGSDDVAE